MSSLHMKSSFCNISLRQNKPSILKCWYGMNWFRCFKLITGQFPPPFFPTRNTLLKISPFKWLVWHMAPFSNMLPISTCTCCLWSRFIWVISGIFCLTGFLLKGVLYPSTSSRIFQSFVSIFHVSTKCFNLPASGNFGTSHAEKIFLINGWTFSNLLVGITCGNDMLNKVSFLFAFTLSIAAAPLLISTETLLLSRCTGTILFEEEFLRPSRAPPRCLWWWAISKGLLFFLTLATKQFDGLFLWFGWRNKMLPKLFTEQVLILLWK